MIRALGICLSIALATGLCAQLQQLKSITVDKIDGGPVTVAFDPMTVNQQSKLRRTWYAINDSRSPVQVVAPGVRIEPSPGGSYLKFETQVTSLVTSQPIAALELRFVMFDIFGDHMGTIRELYVMDVPAAGAFELKPDWAAAAAPRQKPKRDNQPAVEDRPAGVLEASLSDAQRLMYVASFVARVKPAQGELWNADLKSIAAEMGRILRTGVTDGNLQPTRERK